jgi:hypothetical protein
MTEPTGEEREETTLTNYNILWLETIISKHLGMRVSLRKEGCYWWAYSSVFGQRRVTDLLKGPRK